MTPARDTLARAPPRWSVNFTVPDTRRAEHFSTVIFLARPCLRTCLTVAWQTTNSILPAGPRGPVAPLEPLAPVEPGARIAPGGPAGPVAPCGSGPPVPDSDTLAGLFGSLVAIT